MANRQAHVAQSVARADIDQLLAILKDLEDQGQNEIVAALSGELTDAKKRAAIAGIQQAVVVTDGKVKTWLTPAMGAAYIAGANALQDALRSFRKDTALGELTFDTLKSVPHMKPHLDAVNALLSDAYFDFGTSLTGFVKGAEKALSQALRQQVQVKIATGRLAGADIRTIKNDIKNQLLKKGFVSVVDKGGREWSLSTYGEMLARTHIIRANTDATINRATELGVDLFEVSSHGATDDLCGKHEGQIYSKSGKSKEYPKLTQDRTPPFHPNCRHTLLARPDLQPEFATPKQDTNRKEQVLDEETMQKTIDHKAPVTLREGEIELYGVRMTLTDIEKRTLEGNNVPVTNDGLTTRTGRQRAKSSQPFGAFVQRQKGNAVLDSRIVLPLVANKGRTYAQVVHTFYHETGHAIDTLGGNLRLSAAIPREETRAIARDRLMRSMAGTIEKHKLDDKQINALFAGDKVYIDKESGKYITVGRTMVNYVESSKEVFAEAYALYKLDPAKLKAIAPTLFSFISKLK